MLAKSTQKLPIKVAEPDSVSTGELFLSDLLSAGVTNVSPKTITRATCTLGTRYRGECLTEVVIADWYTAVLEYADGRRYQVEFQLNQKRTTDMIVQKLEDYVPGDSWKLLIVSEGPLSPGATRYCASNAAVDIVRLDRELSGDPAL